MCTYLKQLRRLGVKNKERHGSTSILLIIYLPKFLAMRSCVYLMKDLSLCAVVRPAPCRTSYHQLRALLSISTMPPRVQYGQPAGTKYPRTLYLKETWPLLPVIKLLGVMCGIRIVFMSKPIRVIRMWYWI